jgi:hypothetical protein
MSDELFDGYSDAVEEGWNISKPAAEPEKQPEEPTIKLVAGRCADRSRGGRRERPASPAGTLPGPLAPPRGVLGDGGRGREDGVRLPAPRS